MTPKEKAQYLVDEYFSWYGNEEYFSHEFAKECALIAVDEIIKQCYDYRDIDLQASYDYWNEVKTEIKKITL